MLTCRRHYHSSPNKQDPSPQASKLAGCRPAGSDILELKRLPTLLLRDPRQEFAEALAEENLVLQNRVYGTAHPNAAAALELVGHVRAGLAARA